MAMVYTKLERSFDSKELRSLLTSRLSQYGVGGDEDNIKKIERPPLPPASHVFEQAKGELEIERQSQVNGACSLPPYDRDGMTVCRLEVPGTGGNHGRPRSGNRHGRPSGGRVSPRPFSGRDQRSPSAGRRSPLPGASSKPGSPARTSSRGSSPCPPQVTPTPSRPTSYRN